MVNGIAPATFSQVGGFAVTPWLAGGRGRIRRMVLSGMLLFIPLMLWVAYVQVMMGDTVNVGSGNFGWPAWEMVHKLDGAIRDLFSGSHGSVRRLAHDAFEVLCPLSLCVQAGYLFIRPRLREPAWRLGIGFAILLLVLGSSVWSDQNAYSRVLLPLTIAFNLLIHQYEQGRAYRAWYIAGNTGMAWMLLRTML